MHTETVETVLLEGERGATAVSTGDTDVEEITDGNGLEREREKYN